MGLSHSPSIVRSGLDLHFDVVNSRTLPTKQENLVLYSNDFSNNVWGGYCGAKSNQTYNTTDVAAPDGTNTATKIVRGDNGCDGSLSWGIVWNYNVGGVIVSDTDTTYTASIYVRGAVGGEVVRLGLSDGKTSNYPLTTSWQRISYTNSADITTRGLQIVSNNVNQTFYIWGAQLERGSVANPYVETNSTAISRGTTPLDLSKSNQSITLQSGVGYSSDNLGSFTLDGIRNYIEIPSTTISRNGGAFSIWFYVDDFTTFTAGKTVPSRVLVRGDNDYWIVVALYEGGFGYETNTNSDPSEIAGQQIPIYPNSQIISGKWINFVMSNENSQSTFYINGVQNRTLDVSDDLQLAYIGRGQSPANYPDFLKGRVSNFKIYNRALTASEVKQNFDALRGRYGV